jgi:hypothetical protein
VAESDLQKDSRKSGFWPGKALPGRFRWNRALAWVGTEVLLFSLLWVNVLASESPESSRTGRLIIASPTNAAALRSVHGISGVAYLPKGELGTAEIRLRQVATGKCWDWLSDRWSEDAVLRIPLREAAPVPWDIVTPDLSEGRYQVECSLQLAGLTHPASVHSFIVDRTAPSISFFPLHDQETIDDLSDVGGEINEVAEVHFSISRLSDAGQPSEWWDGEHWTNKLPGPSLRGATARGFWFRAADTMLPQRRDLQNGTYLILASAIDRAGNEGRAALTVHKRAVKTASLNPGR